MWTLLVCLLVLVSSCGWMPRTVSGSGTPVQETYELDRFRSLEIGHDFEATVELGETPRATVRVDDNLMEHVRVDQDDGHVAISMDDDVRIGAASLEVRVTAPGLRSLRARGTSRVALETPLEGPDLTVRTSGSSEMSASADGDRVTAISSGDSQLSLESRAQHLDVTTSGNSRTMVVGQTTELSVAGSGSSHSELARVDAARAEVQLSGSSRSIISVSDELVPHLSGNARLTYHGAPTITSQQIADAAQLVAAE